MLAKYFENKYTYMYCIMRVIVGLMFALHGSQKLFSWFGGPGIEGFAGMVQGIGLPAPVFFSGLVGSIEFFGGLAIMLGLFTRFAAVLGSIVMIVALATVHFPQGPVPLQTGGELPLLYLGVFLVMLAQGAGIWSLEKALLKKEMF